MHAPYVPQTFAVLRLTSQMHCATLWCLPFCPKTLLVLEGIFFYLTNIANFYLASFLFNCLLVFFTIKYTVTHTTKYTTTKIAVKIATTCHWNGIQELAR